ncbi:hypothetical protein RvY_17934-2 [Ramazzottius varieornatus]|uniref:THAP-type domain-containing protein n=1 Tax=Ramazzottius varieornatus TaxID=947166 RepID=A0A1D1W7J1_RAMVA|nr:hypothetical protein RvY_17934-2 [Ramazzottius varieornatus]
MFFEEAGNMSDIRPATIVFKFDGDSLLAGSGQRRSQPAKPAKASKATTNLTKCSVRECGVIQQPPSRIVMHSSLQHSDLTVAAWRNFFQMNKFTKFPKRVFICQYHFTEDCHTPKGQLRLNSIPTIRIPLALQAAEGPDEPPSPQSIPSHPVRDAPKGPSPSSPFPRKSSTDQWTGFHDLLNALAPYALKTPSSKWVILNFPHAKPANISFECLEENVSYKSVTFSGSLDATIMIRGNRYTKEETRVCQASELETLLATIDALEVLPCGCVPWGHVSDFEYDLPKVILPSEDWFTFSLIKRQYQILFQRVDDHGRSIKCLSFSLSLLPRLHVRNKRCLENDKDLQVIYYQLVRSKLHFTPSRRKIGSFLQQPTSFWMVLYNTMQAVTLVLRWTRHL